MGMTISMEQNNSECVEYHDFECVIETEDMFLLIYDTRGTVLQKIDIAEGTVDDFCDFISKKVAKYQSLT